VQVVFDEREENREGERISTDLSPPLNDEKHFRFRRIEDLKPVNEHYDPSVCTIRHLTGTLYECLTDFTSSCEKAVVVGPRSFCRHPYLTGSEKESENSSEL
jgi:hypothetical protein